MSETCENCGRQIGNLETPHVFRGHVVCADCDAKLRSDDSTPTPTMVDSTRREAGEERVLYNERPSMWRNRPISFVLVLLLIPWGSGLIILAIWYLKVLGTRLVVSSERVTLRTGVLSKHINEVRHRDIRNVQISQGPLQRLFGVGTIGIASSGHGGIEIIVHGMRDPEQVKRIIDEQRRV